MRVCTFVDGYFCAAHRDVRSNAIHGHTWRVRAWFYTEPKIHDARDLKADLSAVLKHFDHGELSADLSRAEELAPVILNRLECHTGLPCAQVDVWREPEGMGATAWR